MPLCPACPLLCCRRLCHRALEPCMESLPWLQAGGKGSTGFKRVLDIVPEKVGVHMLAG